MDQFEKLTQAGVDMPSLTRRLMGNLSLIRVFIRKFSEDQNFEALKAAFAAGDLKQAEMASHTLKGMCGNLSLNRLYELFTRQVNLIREGDSRGAEAMMAELVPAYEHTVSTMEAWLAEQ